MLNSLKKILLSAFIFISCLNAQQNSEPSTTCKGCHPTIYNEFYDSSHRKASIYNNQIHKASWDAQNANGEKSYTCAKCHTPSDSELISQLNNSQKIVKPKENLAQNHDAISCIYCHSIESIKKEDKHNINILSKKDKVLFAANEKNRNAKEVSFKEEKSLYGLFKKKTGSPFHKIDYSNKDYYNGNTCMGCHATLRHNDTELFNITDANKKEDLETNCITCHMPKVKGTTTTIKKTKEHRFHGFAGARFKQELLSKYVKIKFQSSKKFFNISIKNEASHEMFIHPLRTAALQIEILRGDTIIKLDQVKFEKIIDQNTKPYTYKGNMIKANENRIIKYDFELQEKDGVSVILGYYLVNPNKLKDLKLEDDKESTQFHILKKKFFTK
mgnify:CR=1 FL=1